MISSLLFFAAVSHALDGTSVTCGSSYTDPDFDDLANPEDDDCSTYTGIAPCTDPAAVPSPDRVLNFTSATDAWVEITMTWGRVDLNFYALEDPCGNAVSCASGYGGYFAGTGWLEAPAGEDFYITFDEPGGGGLIGPPVNPRDLDVSFTCCLDNDGDGTYDMAACLFGPGNLTDCDDTDPDNSPGNTELCDGKDNDCDGQVDEGGVCTEICDDGADNDGDSDVDCGDSDCAFFPSCCDLDGDGWSGAACGGSDCDDTDPFVNPGAPELSCDGVDNDCDATTADDPDGDGDGVGACTDCDDSDAANFPGNAESCDGADNDCDGSPDDGLAFSDWYGDGDGDGYGAGAAVSTCDGAPPGHVPSDTDCDDTNPAVHPNAVEVTCDGLDNDCSAATVDDPDADGDGVGVCTDCDDSDASNFPGNAEACDGADNDCDGTPDDGVSYQDWYADGDSDGYGAGAVVSTCDGAPPGHVASDTDCNDADPAIHPGAPEVTCDGLDNDCSAATLDDPDADGDGVGTCTDCDDADGTVHPGATEVACDGVDNDCDAATVDDVDADGDGVGSCTDCDDADASNFPGNVEYCDGLDNDCDGAIDEDTSLVDYWPDGDGDGYGDGAQVPTSTCTGAPPGTVANPDDCDDVDPAVNPGATEASCNGVDDDCDPATIDDPDGDGDGEGVCTDCDDADPLLSTLDLDLDGVSSCDGDCADLDAGRFPGALEIPDGIDQDCDGIVDETTDWVDDDGDGFAEAGGDCDDGDATVFPGAVEDCDGVDDDCDTLVDEDTDCFDDDGDGLSELDGDCNDGDAAVHPGATERFDNGLDDDCDGVTDDGATDMDGDGMTPAAGDCDDADPTTFDGAPELEDGLDNDCDGLVDEGTDAWDDDGDGVSEQEGDCDDADTSVHPGSVETANGIDDDCDGSTDEDTEVSDDDGDGISEVAGDCDDADPSVLPGADEQENGVDDDCDGEIDEDLDDFDGDGFSTADGDCDDDDGWAHPGAEEVCDGIDNDCDRDIDEGCRDVVSTVGKSSGCGCGSVSSTAVPALLLAGLAVLGVRRRRR